MRLDVSSQHPRHLNYLLESDQLDIDEDLLTSWQVFLRAEGKSPKTIKGYLESVRRLLAFTRTQGMPSLARLTREHVAAWMDGLRAAGNKPATIHTRYRGASAFYKWLIMEADEGVKESPFAHIRPPRIPEEVQPHYGLEQLARVLRAAASYTNKIERDEPDKGQIETDIARKRCRWSHQRPFRRECGSVISNSIRLLPTP